MELGAALGIEGAPLPGSARVPRLLAATQGDAPLQILARWFLMGLPVEEGRARENLPLWVVDLLLGCGILARPEAGPEGAPPGQLAASAGRGHLRGAPRDGGAGGLLPRILLEPHGEGAGELLVASDTYQHLASPGGFDHILAVNPTACHLLDFTPRKQVETALDLGTGCGIQALLLASHARRVVATDLNPRAEAFVRLNAALNGVENLEVRTGDLWEPVAGERFDLVVCNPPFVLAPDREFLYRDSGMELDGIVEAVLGGAPSHLNPGGHLHLVAEWVEVQEESWEDRLAGWMAASGPVDAVVFRTHAKSPEAYAEGRLRELMSWQGMDVDPASTWERWRDHHRRGRVRQVVGGLLAVRARTPDLPPGPPRIRFSALDRGPYPGSGEEAHGCMEADDLLSALPGEALLGARLAAAPDLEMEVRSQVQGQTWKPVSRRLVRAGGNGDPVELPADMAGFAAGFGDGSRVRDRATVLAGSLGLPPEPLPAPFVAEVLRVVRILLQRGILRPALLLLLLVGAGEAGTLAGSVGSGGHPFRSESLDARTEASPSDAAMAPSPLTSSLNPGPAWHARLRFALPLSPRPGPAPLPLP